MERLELWNMEYGECVSLLGRDGSVLMVDCGSVSQKLRRGCAPGRLGGDPGQPV